MAVMAAQDQRDNAPVRIPAPAITVRPEQMVVTAAEPTPAVMAELQAGPVAAAIQA